ncbi:MAG: rod shape-determining protein RodA [Kiritimatiellia bacterium]|jgi:rod shape determining protein RodA
MSFFLYLRPLRRMNWSLLAAMLALLGIGIVFIFSAVYGNPDPLYQSMFRKQLYWASLGILLFLGFAIIDYHHWTRMAWWIYAAGLILLVLVFVPHIGHKINRASRWIQLPGFDLQPAELMKLAVIILLSRLFGWPGRNLRRGRLVIFGLALALAPMALIVIQPDLGMALIFLPILAGIMWAAGVPGARLAAWAALGIVLAGGALALIVIPPKLGMDADRHEQLMSRIGITSYQRDRIAVFLDSKHDLSGAGWNKAQSKIAVGSGGLTGKGYLQGTQNLLGFLPRTVAPSDFIFSVIAEEKGFMGGAVTLALFGVLLAAGLRAAESAADKMGRLLCVGIVTMLFCHVFVNIAMTIGLLPVKGIPLPLISYGGTFMICTMTALGIVQSVYIRGEWR